jgi:PAS domain S-box-containing protein
VPTILKGETFDRSNLMIHGHIHRFWRTAAECLAGIIAVILVTFVCFQLRLDLPMLTCLYMMVIVLVSARSSFLSAAIISVIAAGCLDYFFLPPIFSLELNHPVDYVALVAFLTTAMVITHLVSRVRDLAMEKLHRSEAYLSEAQRLSHTGSFGWRVSSGVLNWSEETFRIFQIDPKTKPTMELVLPRVHPDDATLVKETIGRASQDGKDFDLEHRLLMPDGSVKHVRVVAHAERGGSGEVEFVGAVMDVTAAKDVEAKIRLIINTVPGLLWTARPDGWVDFLNQRWLDYTGMTLEQGLGWAWQPGYHPDDLGNVLSKWRAAVAEGKPLETEARLRRFDGEYRWFLKRAFPLFDRAGCVLGWYGGNIDIHDLKQAEEKLRQSESFLSEAQRLSHTGSWARVCATGEIRYWSEEYCRVIGFEPQHEQPRLETFLQRVHPEDRGKVRETVAGPGKVDYELDYRVVLPGGDIRHIHTIGHPIFSPSGDLVEFVGTVMDVTERKLSEALLSSEKHLLEMIAGGAPLLAVLNELCRTIDEQSPGLISTVLSLDEDGQRLWPLAGPGVPQGWTRMVSPLTIGPCVGSCGTAAYRKEAVVVSDIATDPLWADFREAALGFGLKACWSTPLLSTTGLVLGTFAIYCSEIRSPAKRELLLIERATHMAQIAIERDRTQDSLRKAQLNLAHATRVATMGELTASIAHEVNQPLAAVVNNANACISLLPDGDPDLGEVREALAEIIEDADRASDVIARVRQLARKAPVERTSVDLRDVIADVLALARHEFATRRVTIHTEIPKEPPLVLGDRVQLQQVLLNLVVNGMDAMNTVEESKRVLLIRGHRETRDGRLETLVRVQDAGTGFKPEEVGRLFEAFYTTKPQGMGMGLAISRSIIEAHGGRLWAEANQGPGATFLFSLPAAGQAQS